MRHDVTTDTLVPTIVLVGGRLTLEDGSHIDSRQPMADAATARAVRRALVASPEWWSAVISIVMPTLDDGGGGFAFTDQKTLARAGSHGEVRQMMFPRYPRAGGYDDYIYNWRTLGEKAAFDRSVKPTRLERVNRRHAQILEQRRALDARIRIDTDGHCIHNFGCSLRAGDKSACRRTQILIGPDTLEIRALVQTLVTDAHPPPSDLGKRGLRDEPYRKLRLGVVRANCAITGLVHSGGWEDPSELEAARLLLLERFDLRVGLWDLALNPVLRSTVLDPSPVSPAPSQLAQAPVRARKRAELEAGGVERALFDGLSPAGWKLTKMDLGLLAPTGLHHPVTRDTSKHPYLLTRIDRRTVRVLLWHWQYMTFDINAFVDARRAAFDAIAPLPARKQLDGRLARTLTRRRKQGEVVYEKGRFMDDPGWVLLWSTSGGWADLDVDWQRVSNEIADLTRAWVSLLADAIAECIGVERRALVLVDGADQ